MIVTCPACDTRYNLADSQLGATGRTIQCMKCQYSWFQTPATLPSKKESGEDLAEKVPLAPENNESASATAEASASGSDKPKGGISMALPQPVLIGLAVLILALIALVVTLLVANPFAPNVPAGYRAIDVFEGERVGETLNGIVLTQVERKIIKDGDISVLIFTGKVTNTGTLAIDLPEIRVQLLDRKGVELDFWPAQVPVASLEAGASADWSARFLEPDLERISEYRAFFHSDNN